MAVLKERKLKLRECKGEMAWIAKTMGITEVEVDKLRTYQGIELDDKSPLYQIVAKPLQQTFDAAGKAVQKVADSIGKERAAVLIKALSLQCEDILANLLSVTYQNQAHESLCGIVRMPDSESPVSRKGDVVVPVL